MAYSFKIKDNYTRRGNKVGIHFEVSGFFDCYNSKEYRKTGIKVYFLVNENDQFEIDHSSRIKELPYPIPKRTPLKEDNFAQMLELANNSEILEKVLVALKRLYVREI